MEYLSILLHMFPRKRTNEFWAARRGHCRGSVNTILHAQIQKHNVCVCVCVCVAMTVVYNNETGNVQGNTAPTHRSLAEQESTVKQNTALDHVAELANTPTLMTLFERSLLIMTSASQLTNCSLPTVLTTSKVTLFIYQPHQSLPYRAGASVRPNVK